MFEMPNVSSSVFLTVCYKKIFRPSNPTPLRLIDNRRFVTSGGFEKYNEYFRNPQKIVTDFIIYLFQKL